MSLFIFVFRSLFFAFLHFRSFGSQYACLIVFLLFVLLWWSLHYYHVHCCGIVVIVLLCCFLEAAALILGSVMTSLTSSSTKELPQCRPCFLLLSGTILFLPPFLATICWRKFESTWAVQLMRLSDCHFIIFVSLLSYHPPIIVIVVIVASMSHYCCCHCIIVTSSSLY